MKSQPKSLLFMLFSVCLMFSMWSVPLQAQTWSGQVVDARTARPIKGASVKAGTAGRVDAFKGYQVITGDDGRFQITWPEEDWRRVASAEYPINHYLRVDAPQTWGEIAGTGHWQVIVIRRTPGQVVVRMMPRQVYVKGRVLSAENNEPVEKAWVNLGIRKPGDTNASFSIKAGVNTDANGDFSLKPIPGFPTDGAGYPSAWHDIEKGLPRRTGVDPDYSKLLQDYGPMWDFAVKVGSIWYPISPDRIVTSVDEQIHTYVVIRHPAKDKPPHANPVTVEQRGLPGATAPPSERTPSGAVVLTGEWNINANNHRGQMTINQQGSRFTGTILGDQLIEGTITGNTVTFTRKISQTQHYTGTLTVAADGTATMTGTFTQNRGGSYKWTATKTTPSPPTAPEPPPATTPTPAPAGFTVQTDKRSLPQGGSVTVPVSLNNVDALANMNVNVHYDPAVVRPAQNAARGNLISQALFEANIRDRGVVRLGFAQRDDIRGTGTLAQIPFEGVGRPGTRTALRLELTMAATSAGSRVTPAQLIHGEIVIVGADGRVPGDTTGTGTLTALDAMNALKMSVGNLSVDMIADSDQDGQVTARDATLILQAVVGR